MRKKTTREIALEWWDTLDASERHMKQMECGYYWNFNTLTGREVEKIWERYVVRKNLDKQ